MNSAGDKSRGNYGGANIFDEIQQNFLKVIKCNKNAGSENENLNIDCLPTADAELFLPPALIDEADPQLYAVEQGELQPISSPFMVPGIYKKIDTTACVKVKKEVPNNVYVTETETHGRIVRNTEFHRLYKYADVVQTGEQPRKVLLIENKTPNEKPAPSTVAAADKTEAQTHKKWDALSKLAYNLLKLSNCDHTVTVNRNRNEIVRTEKITNQKTIYLFMTDDELGVQPPEANSIETSVEKTQKSKKRLGRPRKPQGSNTIASKVRKIEPILKDEVQKESKKSPVICSRFGRVIKPLKTELMSPKALPVELSSPIDNTRNIISDLLDKDYTCNLKPNSAQEENADKPIATSSPTKRNVPPDSICPTCKKIFLGRRLKRHFVQHPDHMNAETPPPTSLIQNPNPDEMSLFRFLVSKLQKPNLSEDQRADLFLHELNDLVEQLQLRSSRFIRNTSGLHFVNARTARMLSIPEGQYALDMSAIEADCPEIEPNYDNNQMIVPSANTRSMDYTALSLDDTLTDEAAQKLNLSAGGKILPPSEESLLRAVDDLVPPASISKLVPNNLLNRPVVSSTTSSNAVENLVVPHYDHASDNAVEAVSMKENNATQPNPPMLDLSVDFFQFKTS